jgi:cytochrome c peroxidase
LRPSHILFLGFCLTLLVSLAARAANTWTEQQLETMKQLWIGQLQGLPVSPGNRFADDPRAAKLGYLLFFDPNMSSNGEVSCATCHAPDEGFAERKPVSEGIAKVSLNAPTIIGAAYSPWQFWNGRADSLWAQALGPLENAKEMGGNRFAIARYVTKTYAAQYQALFGAIPEVLTREPTLNASPVTASSQVTAWLRLEPEEREAVNRVFANVGKAIEAYERLLIPTSRSWSRFDVFSQAVSDPESRDLNLLSEDEQEGFKLFVGEAGCVTCHSGPRLTDDLFHDTGFAVTKEPGRASGIEAVLAAEFNCISPFSDAPADACQNLRDLLSLYPNASTSGVPDNQRHAFKTPSLRNVSQTAPYGTDGRYPTLKSLLEAKNNPPQGELKPLDLSPLQLRQLEAFLKALDTPLSVDRQWLTAPMK